MAGKRSLVKVKKSAVEKRKRKKKDEWKDNYVKVYVMMQGMDGNWSLVNVKSLQMKEKINGRINYVTVYGN